MAVVSAEEPKSRTNVAVGLWPYTHDQLSRTDAPGPPFDRPALREVS
jgi:hypothetical protein